MCSNPKDWCDVGESLAKLEPWKRNRILEVVTLAVGRGWRRSTQITFRQRRNGEGGALKSFLLSFHLLPSFPITIPTRSRGQGSPSNIRRPWRSSFLRSQCRAMRDSRANKEKPSSVSVIWSDPLRTLCMLTNLILKKNL